MDIFEGITGAIAALNGSLTAVKTLKEIDRSVDEAEFKLKIADIREALAEAKMALTDAKLTMKEQEAKISELEEKLETGPDTVRVEGFLFDTNDAGQPFGFAYCPACEGNKGRKVSLIEGNNPGSMKCPACGNFYKELQTKKGVDIRPEPPEEDFSFSRNDGW